MLVKKGRFGEVSAVIMYSVALRMWILSDWYLVEKCPDFAQLCNDRTNTLTKNYV